MTRTIPNFIAKLKGGGARANRFRVICPFPSFAVVGGETEDLSFLAKGAVLPASTLGVIEIAFNGRKVKMPGDREYTTTWSITVLNDTDFKLRNGFERWQNAIRPHKDGGGLANFADYTVDVIVQQLDQSDSVVKSYTLEGAWPLNIAEIALNYDSTDSIEEFDVEFQFQNIASNTMT